MVVGWRGFPSGLDRVNLWVLICLNNTGERWAGCGGGNTQCFGKSREHGRVGREGSEEGTPKIHCLRVHSWTCGAVTSSLFAHACQLSSLSRLLLSPPNLPLNDHPSFPQPFPPAPQQHLQSTPSFPFFLFPVSSVVGLLLHPACRRDGGIKVVTGRSANGGERSTRPRLQ